MDSVMRLMGGWRKPARAAAVLALTCGVGACGSVMNMMPDPGNFRLPDRSTFLPTSTTFNYTISPTTPVRPADLVDGQGQCAAPPAGTDSAPRGVRLDMTECEVVRTLGQPQSVDITSPGGDQQRRITLTYKTGERPGIYEFTDGRLTGIQQVSEPAPVAKKPPARKSKPQPPA